MHRTAALARSPLFQLPSEGLPLDERCRISYERARAIVNFYRKYPPTFLHRLSYLHPLYS